MANPMLSPVMRYVSKLSFPRLFLLTGALFVLNLIVPDPLPFIDEILLGLGTLLLANLRGKKANGGNDFIDAPPR